MGGACRARLRGAAAVMGGGGRYAGCRFWKGATVCAIGRCHLAEQARAAQGKVRKLSRTLLAAAGTRGRLALSAGGRVRLQRPRVPNSVPPTTWLFRGGAARTSSASGSRHAAAPDGRSAPAYAAYARSSDRRGAACAAPPPFWWRGVWIGQSAARGLAKPGIYPVFSAPPPEVQFSWPGATHASVPRR